MSSASAIDIQAAPQSVAAKPAATIQSSGSAATSGDFAQALQQAAQQQNGLSNTLSQSASKTAAGKAAQASQDASAASKPSPAHSGQQPESAQTGDTRSSQAKTHGKQNQPSDQGGGKQDHSDKASKQQEAAALSGNPLPLSLPVLPQVVPKENAVALSTATRLASDSSSRLHHAQPSSTEAGVSTGAKQAAASSSAKPSNAVWPTWLSDKVTAKLSQDVAATGAATDATGHTKASVSVPSSTNSQPMTALLPTVASASAPSSATPGLPPVTPGASSPFAQTLGNQVSWMIGQGQQAAQLQLNPPQLGPLQISIQIQGDQTQILFQTHHAMVKSALDAAVPQLREMLGQTGNQQISVSVQQQALSSQQFGQGATGGGMAQQGYTSGGGQAEYVATLSEEMDAGVQSSVPVWSGMGLVDAYA